MWINRDISESLQSNHDIVQILRGPRQCGKSSLLLKLDPSFEEVSLDDPSMRSLAQRDPELFLKQFGSKKIFIDEAQYAPNLFPSIKRRVDLIKRQSKKDRETIFRLTGSNQILMDQNIKESLAGRASFFDLNTLSISEILASKKIAIQEILFLGGWPEIHSGGVKNPKKFLDDYISSYIEKDIVLSAGIQKGVEFLRFVQMLAGRTGQLLEFASFGRDLGIDSKTIKEWVSVLARMNIVALVPAFSTNLSSRLIKAPKIFFIDTGLACRLQGWTDANPILTSPSQGNLFENLVFSEIYKMNINYQLGWKIFHWRSRDGEEVDFLVQTGPNRFLFLEAKVSFSAGAKNVDHPEVKKVFKRELPSFAVCHQEGERILDNKIPISHLKRYLFSSGFSN